nr:MAG TPA: hypothetical protein [Caudoviricetes sp.]
MIVLKCYYDSISKAVSMADKLLLYFSVLGKYSLLICLCVF